jgi:hypothetical protein
LVNQELLWGTHKILIPKLGLLEIAKVKLQELLNQFGIRIITLYLDPHVKALMQI